VYQVPPVLAALFAASLSTSVFGAPDLRGVYWATEYRAKGELKDNTGNTVNIENEITEMTKSSLERQVMVSSFNYKIDLLKAAAGVVR
jgi:flagellar basal body rod protein FlgB